MACHKVKEKPMLFAILEQFVKKNVKKIAQGLCFFRSKNWSFRSVKSEFFVHKKWPKLCQEHASPEQVRKGRCPPPSRVAGLSPMGIRVDRPACVAGWCGLGVVLQTLREAWIALTAEGPPSALQIDGH